jgi:DNA-3-methyladenine glycosylase II
MFLMFRLGRLDVVAEGDLGVQEGLRLLDGLDERPGPQAVLERARCWSPLASVGCWYLWRLVDSRRVR